MPSPRFYEFSVEGDGTFPLDMLRYDECWPSDEGKDVPKIMGMPEANPNPEISDKARDILNALWGKPNLCREVFRLLLLTHESELYDRKRRVTLRSRQRPTDARWASFGWKVVW